MTSSGNRLEAFSRPGRRSVSARQETASGQRNRFTTALLMLYVFLAPFGNLTRFGTKEDAYGVTTVIFLLAIAVNIGSIIDTVRKTPIFSSFVILVLWMGMATLFAEDVRAGYLRLAGLAAYPLFACVAFNVNWTRVSVRRLLICFLLGSFLSSMLTLVDWFGLLHIPGVNEVEAGTDVGAGAIAQASGPFARRTAMADFYGLFIPIGVMMFFSRPLPLITDRVSGLIASLMCAICLVLTHNRAGIVGAVIAILIIGILISRSPVKLLSNVLFASALFGAFYWLLTTFFSDQWLVYQATLGFSGFAKSEVVMESDNIRSELFQFVMKSLTVNPIGHGYTVITGLSEHPDADPHNNITQIIWGAGVFGLGWLAWFALRLLRQAMVFFGSRFRDDERVLWGSFIICSLFSYFCCGMMHTTIGTGIAWLLFGVVLKIMTGVSEDEKTGTADRPRSGMRRKPGRILSRRGALQAESPAADSLGSSGPVLQGGQCVALRKSQ